MTGAGRAAKEAMLFSEVSEGFHAYGVGHHRHMAELDQEFSLAAGREVIVTFTPHLVPMNRGILSTIYVRGGRGRTPEDLHAILLKYYEKEPFVHVLPFGETPQTRHVRGSNMTFIGVAKDRIPGRAIICLGARQSGQGRFRAGDPEHEPDDGLAGDDGTGAGGVVSVTSLGASCPAKEKTPSYGLSARHRHDPPQRPRHPEKAHRPDSRNCASPTEFVSGPRFRVGIPKRARLCAKTACTLCAKKPDVRISASAGRKNTPPS